VTLALLNGAGLAARRFFSFYALDRNVQTSDAVTTFIRLPAQTYATREQRITFHEQLQARLLSAPGVAASTVASAAPFSPAGRRQLTSVDGQPTTEPPPDVKQRNFALAAKPDGSWLNPGDPKHGEQIFIDRAALAGPG